MASGELQGLYAAEDAGCGVGILAAFMGMVVETVFVGVHPDLPVKAAGFDRGSWWAQVCPGTSPLGGGRRRWLF